MNLVIMVAACCLQRGQFTSTAVALLIRYSFANYPRPRLYMRFNYCVTASRYQPLIDICNFREVMGGNISIYSARLYLSSNYNDLNIPVSIYPKEC